ncbi:MAG: hypothetical protein IH847_09595 [Acidobacteria bacterium]|nr:hypothetical protein [Acidobacteriota bacterium]
MMEIVGFAIGLLSLILGAIGLILGLQAGLTVSLELPLDPDDVLTAQFEISNSGLLDLKDVRIIAFEIRVEDKNRNLRERNIGGRYTPPAETLAPGESKTVPFKTFISTDAPLVYADIAIIAFYRPAYMTFWQKRQAFRFVSVPQIGGSLRLQKQPAADALAQYDRTIEELRKIFPTQSFDP